MLVTEGLTQIWEVVKNSIRGLYIQQFEIHMRGIFFFFLKMAKCLANVSKWVGLGWVSPALSEVSHSQVRPTASWGHSVGLGEGAPPAGRCCWGRGGAGPPTPGPPGGALSLEKWKWSWWEVPITDSSMGHPLASLRELWGLEPHVDWVSRLHSDPYCKS